MQDLTTVICDSEVRSAHFIEQLYAKKEIMYTSRLKPSLICRLFHKKSVIHITDNKKHFGCHKCFVIWTTMVQRIY